MMMIATYSIYLGITLLVTIVVAYSLYCHGHHFLVDVFGGDEKIARSVNALFVVGFCLVNMAMVTFALKSGERPHNWINVLEIVSSKVGAAIFILGLMHFFNLMLCSQIKSWYCRQQPLEILDFHE